MDNNNYTVDSHEEMVQPLVDTSYGNDGMTIPVDHSIDYEDQETAETANSGENNKKAANVIDNLYYN